jgi:hypothetical protein
MSLLPIVRYMIVCNDWRTDPARSHLINIAGLLYNIRPTGNPPYPLRYPELCVFLALTDCRGQADGWIVCENEDTGQRVFASPRRPITFGPDPLEVVGVPFRIRQCPFPRPGLYSIQFWYNDTQVEQRLVNLR